MVPGSLVTYNACSGPTDVLKGMTGVVVNDGVAKGRNRKIYVKFMVPGKMQSFVKRLSMTHLLWHDKVYGFELRSKADVKRSSRHSGLLNYALLSRRCCSNAV